MKRRGVSVSVLCVCVGKGSCFVPVKDAGPRVSTRTHQGGAASLGLNLEENVLQAVAQSEGIARTNLVVTSAANLGAGVSAIFACKLVLHGRRKPRRCKISVNCRRSAEDILVVEAATSVDVAVAVRGERVNRKGLGAWRMTIANGIDNAIRQFVSLWAFSVGAVAVDDQRAPLATLGGSIPVALAPLNGPALAMATGVPVAIPTPSVLSASAAAAPMPPPAASLPGRPAAGGAPVGVVDAGDVPASAAEAEIEEIVITTPSQVSVACASSDATVEKTTFRVDGPAVADAPQATSVPDEGVTADVDSVQVTATTAQELPQQGGGLRAVPAWFLGSEDCKLVYAAQERYGTKVKCSPYNAGGARSSKVLLSVFDVSGAVDQKDIDYLKDMCLRPVDGFWHISIKAFGHNYDNPRMVDGILPTTLEPFIRYQFVMDTDRTLREFHAYFEERKKKGVFDLAEYDMKNNNCNHFQANLIQYLAGPNRKVGALLTADEVISPLDFARNAPPPEELRRLNTIANHAVMRGMLRMRREAKHKKQAEVKSFVGVMAGLAVTIATVGSQHIPEMMAALH